MKTLLKKNFESFFIECSTSGLCFGCLGLTGNLCVDLERYYWLMVTNGMFYALPKGYAVNLTANDSNNPSKRFSINLYKIENSYLFKMEWFIFDKINDAVDKRIMDDNWCMDETYTEEDNKIIRQKFVEPLRELIKQMKQYYIDHNLPDDENNGRH